MDQEAGGGLLQDPGNLLAGAEAIAGAGQGGDEEQVGPLLCGMGGHDTAELQDSLAESALGKPDGAEVGHGSEMLGVKAEREATGLLCLI